MIAVSQKENSYDKGKMLMDPSPQAVGEAFIEALTVQDFDALEQLFLPRANFHSLVPSAHLHGATAAEAVELLQDWFGDKDSINILQSVADLVQEVLSISYRLRVHDRHNGWQVIEQHAYGVLREGKIAEMRLACSGFLPIRTNDQAARVEAPSSEEKDPSSDELLEFHTGTEAGGSTCALMTPAIRTKLREMQSGQVLEVRVDDPTARGDIEAWSRLSGNPLLEVIEDEGPELRFFVQKK